MCEAQNAANPDGFASILTKSEREIRIPKSDSGLNALATEKAINELISAQRACEEIYILSTKEEEKSKKAENIKIKEK